MFADEARFGRMNRPRPCWAPDGTRPQVACQLVREYVYLYGAVSPKDGTCVYLIMPAPDTYGADTYIEVPRDAPDANRFFSSTPNPCHLLGVRVPCAFGSRIQISPPWRFPRD